MVCAFEGDVLLGPERAADLDLLDQAPAAVGELRAERRVFGIVPAEAHTELQPAVR